MSMVIQDMKQQILLHVISRTTVLTTITIFATMMYHIMFIIVTRWYRENAKLVLVILEFER